MLEARDRLPQYRLTFRRQNKVEESLRGLLLLRRGHNHRGLSQLGVSIERQLPILPLGLHGRRFCQRKCNQTGLSVARLNKLGRLANALSQDQLVRDFRLQSEVIKRRHRRTSVRRMLRIGNRNAFDGGLREYFDPQVAWNQGRTVRHPEYEVSHCIDSQG